MVGAVFDEAAATQTPFEDVYAPPSADDSPARGGVGAATRR
jgi:hypothetical protein